MKSEEINLLSPLFGLIDIFFIDKRIELSHFGIGLEFNQCSENSDRAKWY